MMNHRTSLLLLPLAFGCSGPGETEPVDFGAAGAYVILAKTAITAVPSGTEIEGDIAVSPAAASDIAGFDLVAHSTGVYSTSTLVAGRVFASDFAPPTPDTLTLAVDDMELAYTDAAGRDGDFTEYAAGDLGGGLLRPGVYKWGTGVLIPEDVTLSGDGVWILQVAGDLTMSDDTDVVLARGALADNVFWQVAGRVDLGTDSHFEGSILSQTGINLRTGASVNGKLLAQSSVTLDGNTVGEP